MKNVLFSAEETDMLNQKVSRQIAPHLFLFCNYQPDLVKVFNPDAQFLEGVMNLYKLVFDAGIIVMIPKIARLNKVSYDKNSLEDRIRTVHMLRTVLAHNVSDRNGTGELHQQFKYWIKQVTGKTEISLDTDYQAAISVLEKTGSGICEILNQFIEQAALCKKQESIISTWEDVIFEFYKKKTNEYIFLGQMRNAYLSRCSNGSIQNNRLKRKVADWFRCFYCKKEEDQINNLQKILDEYGQNLSSDVCKDIKQEIQTEKEKLIEKNMQIADAVHCSSPARLTVYHYQEYYCLDLVVKLKKTLQKMKESGQANMLPEYLMQELIEEEFGDVHSEDF